MDLNKHIVTDVNGSPFHSNGFACVNGSGRIGTTSNMTFAQRQEIEKNRRLIYGYQRSAIGSTYGAMRAASATSGKIAATGATGFQSRQQFNSMGGSSANSVPVRKYDPYA